jgi:hypothetical protein
MLKHSQNGFSRKVRKGTSILEVMVALVFLLLSVIGGGSLFASGLGQIHGSGDAQTAVRLAAQKIEQLKSGAYDSIVQPDKPETINMGGLSYTRRTIVSNNNLYKEVMVVVSWSKMAGHQHSVGLTTYVAPR